MPPIAFIIFEPPAQEIKDLLKKRNMIFFFFYVCVDHKLLRSENFKPEIYFVFFASNEKVVH